MKRPTTRYCRSIGNQVKPRNPFASGPFGSRTRSDRVSPLTWTTSRTSPTTSSSALGPRSSRSSIGLVTGSPFSVTRRARRQVRTGWSGPVVHETAERRRCRRGKDDVVRLGAPGGIGSRFQRMQAGDGDPVAAIVRLVLRSPLLDHRHRRLGRRWGGLCLLSGPTAARARHADREGRRRDRPRRCRTVIATRSYAGGASSQRLITLTREPPKSRYSGRRSGPPKNSSAPRYWKPSRRAKPGSCAPAPT